MVNLATGYPKETPWAEFSAKVVNYYNLPDGSRFALKRHGASAKNGRTIVRSDFKIRRKLLRDADHPNRRGKLKASELFKRVEKMLAPHHKFSVIGFGPDGLRVEGNTDLSTWRGKAPRASQQQIQQETEKAWLRREEIGKLSKLALMMIADLKEGIEDPEEKIPHAVIQALLDTFGYNSVKDAVVELRLYEGPGRR